MVGGESGDKGGLSARAIVRSNWLAGEVVGDNMAGSGEHAMILNY